MAVYTINNYDGVYQESRLNLKHNIYNGDYQDVLIASPILIMGPPRIKFDMSGFDSVGDVQVFWTSYDSPDETPPSTTPALVGTLQFPHIINESMA